jgi:hypothetical protein
LLLSLEYTLSPGLLTQPVHNPPPLQVEEPEGKDHKAGKTGQKESLWHIPFAVRHPYFSGLLLRQESAALFVLVTKHGFFRGKGIFIIHFFLLIH